VRVADRHFPSQAGANKCAPRCEAAREKRNKKEQTREEREPPHRLFLIIVRAATISGEEKAIFHLANTFATSEIITRCAAK